jgi:Glycine zipper 2TM domain
VPAFSGAGTAGARDLRGMFKRALLATSLSGCTAVGAVGGGFAGYAVLGAVDHGDEDGAAKTGAVFGAVAGALIGYSIDRALLDLAAWGSAP